MKTVLLFVPVVFYIVIAATGPGCGQSDEEAPVRVSDAVWVVERGMWRYALWLKGETVYLYQAERVEQVPPTFRNARWFALEVSPDTMKAWGDRSARRGDIESLMPEESPSGASRLAIYDGGLQSDAFSDSTANRPLLDWIETLRQQAISQGRASDGIPEPIRQCKEGAIKRAMGFEEDE